MTRAEGEYSMSALQRLAQNSWAFVIDYIKRHRHPVNAILHIAGVPIVFFGVYELFAGQVTLGISLVVLGYFFQYLGHKAQGNEVGEVTLAKKIWKKLQAKDMPKTQ